MNSLDNAPHELSLGFLVRVTVSQQQGSFLMKHKLNFGGGQNLGKMILLETTFIMKTFQGPGK